MTDNANCGGCGLACSTTCGGGRCVEQLATEPSGNAAILATDGVNLYWSTVNPNGGPPCQAPCSTLNMVPVGGGASVQLLDVDPSTIIDGPTIDGQKLYWIIVGNSGSIYTMPLSGGPVAPVLSGYITAPLAVVSGRLFYVSWSGPTSTTNDLTTSPVSGGSVSVLDSISSSPSLGMFTAIAADGTTVYWGASGEASPQSGLMALPIDQGGSQPIGLAVVIGRVDVVALDATHVYYASDTALQRVPKAGGAPVTLAALTPAQGGDALTIPNIVVDATYVYFTDVGDGAVKKVPLGGGAVTTLVSGTGFPRYTNGHGVAVDATSAYWTTGKALMKVTPK